MSTNLFRTLRSLLPEPPLLVATVVSVNAGAGTSLVQFSGGGNQTVRGTDVAAGQKAFVRNGLVEGPAPALPLVTIEV